MYSTLISYKKTSSFICITMAVSRDDILQLLKERGPLVPNEIKKVLGGDSIILGATLAELSSRKLVKISQLKKGGSPFYFLPNQEAQLERCVEYLNPKDAQTVEFLKEKKVVADRELELFQRVSLRQIKDFAKEFKAQTAHGEVLFWRYYLVSEQEAIDILNQRNRPAPQPSNQSTIQTASHTPESAPPSPVSSAKEVSSSDSFSEQSSQSLQKDSSPHQPLPPPVDKDSSPSPESAPPSPVSSAKEVSSPHQPLPPPAEKEIKKPLPKKLPDKQDSSPQEIPEEPIILESTPFLEQCRGYFEEKNIVIVQEELIKKNSEYEFVVLTPSPVGELKMLVRAKNKKRLNEGDVAPALLRAKTRELPCLFLHSGDFTKKSLKLIDEEYKGVILTKLD